jgi:hypothetical protein
MGFAEEVVKIEMIEGLERALDRSWARLRDKARTAWESQVAKPDPSDACVSVRIGTDGNSQPLPGSAFLPKPEASRDETRRLPFPRFAR